jgi:tRNA-splicing ligase RtcB
MRIDVQVIQDVRDLLQEFKSLTPEVQGDFVRAHDQLGTLGGGNHFIEVCEDTDGLVWLMLHSGSRWIGKTLAEIHMSKAIDLGHNIGLPDRALSVFLSGTPEMAAYRRDLFWAQRYAMANRKVMMDLLMQACVRMWPSCVSTFEVWCHHNYVAEELHYGEELIVTRKGAINADAGRYGIIPGAMGSKSYIVRGLGNPESLCSAPHGAGRKMSRGAAKRKFELEDLIRQTEGTYCRKDRDVIDEIPGAYKSIEKVIENSSELVEVVAELQPAIVCVKG